MKVVSAAWDWTATVWDVETGKATSIDHSYEIPSISWSPDGTKLAFASKDNTVCVWDAEMKEELHCFEGHKSDVFVAHWNPNGRKIVSASHDGTVRTWNTETGKEIRCVEECALRSIVWSPDGKKLAYATDVQTLNVWDEETNKLVVTFYLSGVHSSAHALAWSSNGKRLVSGHSDGSMHLWDLDTGQLINSISNSEYDVRSLQKIRVSTEGSVYDPQTGKRLNAIQCHHEMVCSIMSSPDGTKLASASEDGTIRIWRFVCGDELDVRMQ